jgi:hypothetical protein
MRLVGLVALFAGCAFACGTDACSRCRPGTPPSSQNDLCSACVGGDAGNSDADDGARDGGDTGNGASDSGDASDGGDGGAPDVCRSGRAVLVCTFDGGGLTCLSDDGVSCRPGPFETTACTNQCAPNQSAFVCGWLPGGEPQGGGVDPVPPGVCTVVLHTAAGFTFYCCSSGP